MRSGTVSFASSSTVAITNASRSATAAIPSESGTITRVAERIVCGAVAGSAAIARVAATGTPRVTAIPISVTTAVATP